MEGCYVEGDFDSLKIKGNRVRPVALNCPIDIL